MESKNEILWLHAEWLLNNGYYKEYIDCKKQALNYDPHEDVRQIRFGKKHEVESEI